jgi:hypothetical protein
LWRTPEGGARTAVPIAARAAARSTAEGAPLNAGWAGGRSTAAFRAIEAIKATTAGGAIRRTTIEGATIATPTATDTGAAGCAWGRRPGGAVSGNPLAALTLSP